MKVGRTNLRQCVQEWDTESPGRQQQKAPRMNLQKTAWKSVKGMERHTHYQCLTLQRSVPLKRKKTFSQESSDQGFFLLRSRACTTCTVRKRNITQEQEWLFGRQLCPVPQTSPWLGTGLFTIRSKTLTWKAMLPWVAAWKDLKNRPTFAEHSISWSAES